MSRGFLHSQSQLIAIARVCGALLAVVSMMVCVSGCKLSDVVETRIVKPKDDYDISLSAEIKNKANLHKTLFVEHKLEDEEVDDSLTEQEQRANLAQRYEKGINALFVGNVRQEEDFRLVLDLVEYSTELFQENLFSDQLRSRSPALADFMIDYQIKIALNDPDNLMLDDQIEVQEEIMAEQQSDYTYLKARYERLKQTEQALRQELAELKIQNEEVSQAVPEPLAE